MVQFPVAGERHASSCHEMLATPRPGNWHTRPDVTSPSSLPPVELKQVFLGGRAGAAAGRAVGGSLEASARTEKHSDRCVTLESFLKFQWIDFDYLPLAGDRSDRRQHDRGRNAPI